MKADFVVVIANGEFSASPAQLEMIRQTKCLIAVDGGIDHCAQANLDPHLLVGDLDSASPATLATYTTIPRVTLSREKDQSDLEIALEEALKRSDGPIRVFGALGSRTDHLIYNLYLLTRYAERMTLESQKERLFIIRDTRTLHCHPGQLISLLPLDGPVIGICSKGLQWELEEAIFDNRWMSLSNVCLGNEITISLKQGNLLCCLQLG